MEAGTAGTGTAGRDLRAARRPPLAVAGSAAMLTVASLGGSVLAYASKAACLSGAVSSGEVALQAHCYNDIAPLYILEGLAAGQIPYLGHPVEYPVLTGAAMQAAAWLVRDDGPVLARSTDFFEVTAVLLAAFTVAAVLATGYLAGPARRPAALLVALSPALVLTAFINWDLIAMSLATLGLAAWAARRGVLAGLLLGLAVAAKFYPVVFLVPLLLLCLRAGKMRAFWVTTGSAAAAWLVVNLPVALAAPAGWARFYQFSAQRGPDWGSVWYYFLAEHWPVLGGLSAGALNLASALATCALFALIAVLALAAPRRPRLAQLVFLTVAAFLLVSKVWSPQYVIWLVPLAVLARPRLAAYLLWQLAEVGYFFAIWAYLITQGPWPAAGGIGPGPYFAALTLRSAALLLLAALVVRDILRPSADVVRAGGVDDPAGGVLADAPDRFRIAFGRPPGAW
jgi:uncharacterized membrane protein